MFSHSKRNFLHGSSARVQLVAGFVCVSILTMVMALVTILSLSHFGSRPEEEARNVRRISTIADTTAIDTLQCRRYEKDMFLNMNDPDSFNMYKAKWDRAVEMLYKNVDLMGTISHDSNFPESKLHILEWKDIIGKYQASIAVVISGIESGEITQPSQANRVMTPYKDDVRSLIINSAEQGVAWREQSRKADARMKSGMEQFRILIVLLASVSLVLGGIFSVQANAIAAQAESASRSKSEFLANMSHEIRTPMTAILGFTDRIRELEDMSTTSPERIDAIDTIKRNGLHLLTIINDILDISKIEAGKFNVESIRCSPVAIIAEVQSLMKIRAVEKSIGFEISYIGEIPEFIESDPTRLKQILVNLVGNAIKFTQSGSVRVITSCVELDGTSYLQFDVVDTGEGMTGEQMGRLFHAFSQGDSSTTRKHGGTGLGLKISRQLAELLGGSVTVVSSEPRMGSVFRATITTGSLDNVRRLSDPLSATTVFPESLESTSGSADLSLCSVLLAEDGPDNQRLITMILERAGACVEVVENGQLAMDAAMSAHESNNPFDVILMDIQMPVMDGYDATRQLRAKGYKGSIIALTAHTMQEDRDRCIGAGFDEFANKPVNRASLLKMVWQSANRSNLAA